ncbi:MAG: DUF342 domain-containing protein, partial [Chloroflexota bacterium]
GTPPDTIDGEVIASVPPRDVDLEAQAGDGVSYDERSERLVAAVEGTAVLQDQIVRVLPRDTGTDWIRVASTNRRDASAQAAELLGCAADELYTEVEARLRLTAAADDDQPEALVVRCRKDTGDGPPFSLWCQPEGCMIEVRPAARGSLAFSVLAQEVQSLPLKDLRLTALEEALNQAGQPLQFASADLAAADPSGLGALVGDGEMACWLVPTVPNPRLAVATGLKLLGAAGVVHGVDRDGLDLAAGSALSRPFRVATGTEPEAGTPDRVEVLFGQGDLSIQASDGRVDFRELNLQAVTRVGEALARLVQGSPPRAGRTVTGRAIPGPDLLQPRLGDVAGQNTAVSGDGAALLATVGGLPLLAGGKISVIEAYRIDGDVDFSTGNVDFDGNVIIRGSIRDGFKVKASGMVVVGETVEAAEIEAGSSVQINGGVVGRKHCRIVAGGQVAAKFVHSAMLIAEGDVLVGSEITDSNVFSKGTVTVDGAGRIAGGHIIAVQGISAIVAGSPSHTATWLEVADSPEGTPWADQASVEVLGDCWPRVTVKLGSASTRVHDAISGVRFLRNGLAVEPYGLPEQPRRRKEKSQKRSASASS